MPQRNGAKQYRQMIESLLHSARLGVGQEHPHGRGAFSTMPNARRAGKRAGAILDTGLIRIIADAPVG